MAEETNWKKVTDELAQDFDALFVKQTGSFYEMLNFTSRLRHVLTNAQPRDIRRMLKTLREDQRKHALAISTILKNSKEDHREL